MEDNVLLLHPAEPKHFDSGRKVHNLPDELLAKCGPYILETLKNYCGNRYEGIVMRSNGQGVHMPASAWQFEIGEERRAWLRDLAVQVNVRTAGPGMWVFAWDDTNEPAPRTWTMLWFDNDGDLQLEAKEEDHTFDRMKAIGFEPYVENAAKCIAIWAERLMEVELSSYQFYKAAQGEQR